MTLHIHDEHKEHLKEDLFRAFRFAHSSKEDIHADHLRNHDNDLNETDLSHVFIQHGEHKKGVHEQSYVSQSLNGGFITSKKDNAQATAAQFLLRRNIIDSLRDIVAEDIKASTKSLFDIQNMFDFDFSDSLSKMKNYATSAITLAETSIAGAQAGENLGSEINFAVEGDFKQTLDNVLRNEDGSPMNKAQKKVFEDTNLVCAIPTFEEYEEVHNNATQLIAFEQKLADPLKRTTLTIADMPQEIIEQIKEQRLSNFYDDSLNERKALHDKIAESHGFSAANGKTAYEVYEEAYSAGQVDVQTSVAIRTAITDTNAAFDAEFDAQWAREKERHMQTALDLKLQSIKDNDGIYIPESNIDRTKLDQYGQALSQFREDNLQTQNNVNAPELTAAQDTTAHKTVYAPKQDFQPQIM